MEKEDHVHEDASMMTRKEFKKHKCYLETRELDLKYQNREFRLKKIAQQYEQRREFTDSDLEFAKNDLSIGYKTNAA